MQKRLADKDKQPVLKHAKPALRQKLADWITRWAGSWLFIGIFFTCIFFWALLNTFAVFYGVWDPYPFILLNLFLSCLAAVQAPIILMSQNRMAEVDRQRAQYDYLVNRRAERGIKQLQIDVLEIKGVVLKQPSTDRIIKLRAELKKIQEELETLQTKK
ncbi:MAG: DUF1003 domain-containing protein [archaeon]|jgi:uncharacterized membrane protein